MSASVYPHGDEPALGGRLPSLYNLVYCSRASAAVDDASVERIVASAQRHNPAHGITGLLVFGGGIFFQWLEGPRDNVTQLMTKLQNDPRHSSIVTLSQAEDVRERLFPQWDMERVGVDDVRDVLLDALSAVQDRDRIDVLRALLGELDEGVLSALDAG